MALTRAVSDFKDSVKAATTTNITLTGGAPTTVDGVSLSANDSVLVRSQTDSTQNGLYRVTTLGTGANGTWTRRSDFNASNQVSAGALIFVEQGTTNGNVFYYLPGGIGTVSVGSTALNFSNLYSTISSGGTYSNSNVAAYLPTYSGTLTASSVTTTSGGQITGYLTGAIGANTANTGAFTTITTTSNVGIGTSSPGYLLDVQSTSTSAAYYAGKFYSAANASGVSATYLRLEKGTGYGGAIGGYLSQGVGSGLVLATVNGGTFTDQMWITNAGNMGIGTASPAYPIQVVKTQGATTSINVYNGNASYDANFIASSAAGSLQIGVAGTSYGGYHGIIANGGYVFSTVSSGLQLISDAAAPIQFFNNSGTERMRIDSGGNMGIGTSSPNSLLQTQYAGNYNTIESGKHGFQTQTGTTTSDYTLFMGSDKTNGLSYIQSVNWAINKAPLILNGQGGNVGIGTSSPTTALHVVGQIQGYHTGAIGANTANSGAFTTLSASSTTSLNNYSNIYISTGSAASTSALSIVGNVYGQGGTGYLDILKVTNTYSAVTNPSKYFRLNQTGGLEIVNSAYSATIFSLSDSGLLNDGIGNVRDIPQNSQSGAYTLVASDNGKHISITTGGVTVPAGVFTAGKSVVIFNNSASSQTITQGTSVTMYLSGTATTGNRTLAQYGLCTVLCYAANSFVISGSVT
jgi:hypothetical protein